MRRLLWAALIWCLAATSFAHEVRPAFLKIAETKAGEFSVVWKQPVLSGQRLRIKPTFPQGCEQSEPRLFRNGDTVAEKFSIICDLRQGTVSLPGLENTLTDAFVEITYLDETSRSALLKPANPLLSLSGPQASPAKAYLGIGVEHIIFGWDHLLFVIGLTLLVGGRRVWGVSTAFTLAHSITLAATSLGGINLPSRPVEILIAGSIVLLGVEVMHKRSRRETLGVRRPYLIAFAIGLIHGFGFAGALAEIGLPQGTEFWALLLFNLGVELGQFAVIALSLFCLCIVTKLGQNWRKAVEIMIVYGFATIAMFWVFQRVAPYFGSA